MLGYSGFIISKIIRRVVYKPGLSMHSENILFSTLSPSMYYDQH